MLNQGKPNIKLEEETFIDMGEIAQVISINNLTKMLGDTANILLGQFLEKKRKLEHILCELRNVRNVVAESRRRDQKAEGNGHDTVDMLCKSRKHNGWICFIGNPWYTLFLKLIMNTLMRRAPAWWRISATLLFYRLRTDTRQLQNWTLWYQ